MSKFIGFVENGKIEEAINFGQSHPAQQLNHSAKELRSGRWFSRSAGKHIPAVPGFGPATVGELHRIIPLIGEDQAYEWAKNQPELSTFVWLWDEGRFRHGKTYLAPQVVSTSRDGNKVTNLAAARAKKLKRSKRDQNAWAAKGGKKKQKA